MIDEIRLNNDLIINKYYSLFFTNEKILVLSDLHIGFEEVMAQKGLLLPKIQTSEILELLDNVIDRYKPEQILIDGDFKHEFSQNVEQEWRDIKKIIEFILSRTKLTIVRGNHDNFLKNILTKYNVPFLPSIKINNYLIAHGDKMIDKKNNFLILGHEHPSLKIRDSIGAIVTIPAFLYAPEDKILVLPSPSIYSSGSDILSSNTISPIIKDIEFSKFIVYGISKEMGLLYLGDIQGLKDIYTFLM
jgi:hypothetical protein